LIIDERDPKVLNRCSLSLRQGDVMAQSRKRRAPFLTVEKIRARKSHFDA
jgi:hypothetical protein